MFKGELSYSKMAVVLERRKWGTNKMKEAFTHLVREPVKNVLADFAR